MRRHGEIPEGGINPYASHLGFSEDRCQHQTVVTHRDAWGNMSGCGFGCSVTGGHCLPSECKNKLTKGMTNKKT